MNQIPVFEPPVAGTEVEHLFGMLDRLRATFRYKTDELSYEQLNFKLPSSYLSLGGLLQHLAVVEDEKFTWLIAGQKPEILLELTGDDANPFDLRPEEASQIYDYYDRSVRRSRIIQNTLNSTAALDSASYLKFDDQHPSVRRILCDLVEEYGRHTGHADLLREAVDGRVGEDPPGDYVPPWYRA